MNKAPPQSQPDIPEHSGDCSANLVSIYSENCGLKITNKELMLRLKEANKKTEFYRKIFTKLPPDLIDHLTRGGEVPNLVQWKLLDGTSDQIIVNSKINDTKVSFFLRNLINYSNSGNAICI